MVVVLCSRHRVLFVGWCCTIIVLQRLFCLAGLECAYLVYGSVRVGVVGVSRKDYTISFSFLFFFFG